MDLSLDKEPGLARVTWSGDGGQSHEASLHSSLASLQSSNSLVDVSLVSSSGQPLTAHKIVLAAASELLRELFQDNEEKVNRELIDTKMTINCRVQRFFSLLNGFSQPTFNL